MRTLAVFILLLVSWKISDDHWITEKHKDYSLLYTANDKTNVSHYNKLFENGMMTVKKFFTASFSKRFDIIIHFERKSLDSTWQKEWKMPTFKSECWMVASGVADRLDIISPKTWNRQACDHKYENTTATQQVITHELVHVYHGQHNASPDFSNAEGIDWFVEGLATFASGQCDSSRIADVKKAIAENKIPNTLDNFWTGNLKYGLSGSVVMFIDKKYGRQKLKELLPLTKKAEILSVLNTTETALLNNWKKYFISL